MDTIKTNASMVPTDLDKARLELTRAIADRLDDPSRANTKRVKACRAEVLRLESEYASARQLQLQAVAAMQPKPKSLFQFIFGR